jgi:hypothetical protein
LFPFSSRVHIKFCDLLYKKKLFITIAKKKAQRRSRPGGQSDLDDVDSLSSSISDTTGGGGGGGGGDKSSKDGMIHKLILAVAGLLALLTVIKLVYLPTLNNNFSPSSSSELSATTAATTTVETPQEKHPVRMGLGLTHSSISDNNRLLGSFEKQKKTYTMLEKMPHNTSLFT